MTFPQLQQFNGSSVAIKVDGEEALGILFFADTGEAYVTTLCYLEPRRECPLIKHVLSDEELQTLSRKTHNQLLSQINLSTRVGSFTREEEAALRRERPDAWHLVQKSMRILPGISFPPACRRIELMS